MPVSRSKKLFLIACSSAILVGCAANSVTGRQQFNLMNANSVIQKSNGYYAEAIEAFEKEDKISEDLHLTRRVTDITNRLIDQAVLFRPEAAQWDWKLEVIDDPDTLNAWCMPGGKMAIYTGLIHKLDLSDDEIAAIMGHEIAHALADHGAEKMSVQMASNLAILAIGLSAGRTYEEKRDIINVGSLAALAFVNLPNSRGAEYEADKIGVELSARAGYDPDAAASVWEKMGRESGGGGGNVDFLSTHPAPAKRQETLRKLAEDIRMANLEVASKTGEPNPWIKKSFNDHKVFSGSDYIASKTQLTLLTKEKTPEKPSSVDVGLPVLAAISSPSVSALQNATMSSTDSNKPTEVQLAVVDQPVETGPTPFSKGEIALDCGIKCQPLAAAKHLVHRSYYSNGKWEELSASVIETGVSSDLNWFYLGVAAKNLGHNEAARSYLERAVAISNEDSSCSVSLFTNCFGLKVPQLANESLAAMGFKAVPIPERVVAENLNAN